MLAYPSYLKADFRIPDRGVVDVGGDGKTRALFPSIDHNKVIKSVLLTKIKGV